MTVSNPGQEQWHGESAHRERGRTEKTSMHLPRGTNFIWKKAWGSSTPFCSKKGDFGGKQLRRGWQLYENNSLNHKPTRHV